MGASAPCHPFGEWNTVFDDEALRGAGNSKKRENQAGGA